MRLLGSRDRHIEEGETAECGTFSLHCFLLLARSSIWLDIRKKVGAGSVYEWDFESKLLEQGSVLGSVPELPILEKGWEGRREERTMK